MIKGRVILRKGREESVLRRHPWVFSGAIHHADKELTDGDWVEVLDSAGKTLGYAHYQQGNITLRMLVWGTNVPGPDFWHEKLSEAFQLRKTLNLPSSATNAYRMVHGEGDGLPGLIIDIYNGVAVMQAHSAGMHRNRNEVAEALKKILGNSLQAVYYKSRGTLPGELRQQATDEYLLGNAITPQQIMENNCLFEVNWTDGQKTGFFLDQRDNRALVAAYSTGRTVLNAFCYTGGFSVYALKAGALRVDSIDASARAIELTKENLKLNGFAPTDNLCLAEDAFDYLETSAGKYDMIILDPPAFAKHRQAKHQAIKGYQRLNALALKNIRSKGIVATFSCSQIIDSQLFYDTIVSAAVQAGRNIRVLCKLCQPSDHPVSAFHPEGEYLKGLVLYVM